MARRSGGARGGAKIGGKSGGKGAKVGGKSTRKGGRVKNGAGIAKGTGPSFLTGGKFDPTNKGGKGGVPTPK